MTKPDLSEFTELTASGGTSWEKRSAKIRERFPSTAHLDWKKAFDNDIDLFGRILRDVLKVDQSQPGRPGPRPALDYKQGVARLRQLMGQDYTCLPFHEAFKILSDGRSIRHLAVKTGLDRNMVYKLLRGDHAPDVYAMSQVAKSFDKHPSFFLEYRIMYIAAALMERMEWAPESTIGTYRKLSQHA